MTLPPAMFGPEGAPTQQTVLYKSFSTNSSYKYPLRSAVYWDNSLEKNLKKNLLSRILNDLSLNGGDRKGRAEQQ